MGKTSWQVKQKYNDKVYKQISFRVKKELAESFDETLKRTGDSKASVLKKAIENYIEKN